jgi:hypothetical protein
MIGISRGSQYAAFRPGQERAAWDPERTPVTVGG